MAVNYQSMAVICCPVIAERMTGDLLSNFSCTFPYQVIPVGLHILPFD